MPARAIGQALCIASELARHDLACCAQGIVCEVRVSLGGARVRVSKQAPDDRKAQSAGNQMGRVRVTVIVEPVIAHTCVLSDAFPEAFEVLEWLSGLPSREDIFHRRVALHLRQKGYGCTGQRERLRPLLFGVVRRFRPDATVEVGIVPSCGQDLADPRAGQKLQADGVGGELVGMRVEGVRQAAEFFVRQPAITFLLVEPLDASCWIVRPPAAVAQGWRDHG